MRHRVETRSAEGSQEELLLRRARRHARHGEARKALLAAREACYLVQGDARLWAIYGSYCWKAGRISEACDAIRQAIWYRQRNRDTSRAAALKNLLAKLEQGTLPSAA